MNRLNVVGHTLKVVSDLLKALAAVWVISTGCARTIATVTPYQQRPAKESAAEIVVFTDVAPDRPYEELGLIEIKQMGITTMGYGQLVLRAREEAAQMGADAIIVTRTPKKSVTTVGTTTGRRRGNSRNRNTVESSTEHETPRISVTAIVWKP